MPDRDRDTPTAEKVPIGEPPLDEREPPTETVMEKVDSRTATLTVDDPIHDF